MSLLTEIREAVRALGVPCRVQVILAELDETDRGDLEEALRDTHLPATAIVEVLRRRDIKISDQSVNRHRRRIRGEGGGCLCQA